MNEVAGAKVDSDAAKEFVLTIESIVKDVTVSQSGWKGHEDGSVVINSGASVNVCPKGLENPFLGGNQTDQFDSEVRTEEHSKITERKATSLVKIRKPWEGATRPFFFWS